MTRPEASGSARPCRTVRENFCCFKPPRLWRFVTAVTGTQRGGWKPQLRLPHSTAPSPHATPGPPDHQPAQDLPASRVLPGPSSLQHRPWMHPTPGCIWVADAPSSFLALGQQEQSLSSADHPAGKTLPQLIHDPSSPRGGGRKRDGEQALLAHLHQGPN